MLKLDMVTKVKVLFLVLVFVFNFDLFEFPTAILEKGLLIELKRKENMNRDTSYARPLEIKVNLSRRNLLTLNDLLPKQRVQQRPVYTGDFCRGNSIQFLSR